MYQHGLARLCNLKCGNGANIDFAFSLLQIVSTLEIEPKKRPTADQFAKAQCHGNGDRLLLDKDVVQRLS